jgi:hypothetical protein
MDKTSLKLFSMIRPETNPMIVIRIKKKNMNVIFMTMSPDGFKRIFMCEITNEA